MNGGGLRAGKAKGKRLSNRHGCVSLLLRRVSLIRKAAGTAVLDTCPPAPLSAPESPARWYCPRHRSRLPALLVRAQFRPCFSAVRRFLQGSGFSSRRADRRCTKPARRLAVTSVPSCREKRTSPGQESESAHAVSQMPRHRWLKSVPFSFVRSPTCGPG